MKSVLIFGAGQVAQVVRASLINAGYLFSAYVVDDEYWKPEMCSLIPKVEPMGRIGVFPYFSRGRNENAGWVNTFIIGLSFKGLNAPRAAKYQAMLDKGYEPLTFVDYRSINNGKVGQGSFVMELNNIQHGAEIGENCVLWAGNHVGHHARIGNHVWISSHAVISGACEIGDRTFVGVNATITDGVKIGRDCIIGAGALVTKDLPDESVVQGVPSEISKVPSSRMRGVWSRA